jgi:hypothetical protein
VALSSENHEILGWDLRSHYFREYPDPTRAYLRAEQERPFCRPVLAGSHQWKYFMDYVEWVRAAVDEISRLNSLKPSVSGLEFALGIGS